MSKDKARYGAEQIQVLEGLEADRIFSVLMGDKVEPRRKFIEDNAKKVRNLDL